MIEIKTFICIYDVVIFMSKPDESVNEYICVTNEECEVAKKHKDKIKNNGATHVRIIQSKNQPNKIYIWGPDQVSVNKASDYYETLKDKYLNKYK